MANPMYRPTPEKPLLVGIMVDVSGSMTTSINNKSSKSQNRLQSFRASFQDLVEKAKDLSQTGSSREVLPLLKLFAYGFGFGNPIATIFKSIPSVQDFLKISSSQSSTVTIDRLADEWDKYQRHIERLIPEMFGSTPMGDAFQQIQRRFKAEMADGNYTGQPILFVLSDGEPTDSQPEQIIKIADEIKKSGVIIVSCFVTQKDITSPRYLYGSYQPQWDKATKLMFDCSSEVEINSSFYSYMKEYNWVIEKNGRLFTQINQSEILSEFMKVILSPLEKSQQTALPSQRSKLFISYSHRDEEYLSRVLIHLKPLERRGIIDVWSDKKIKPGQDWRKEIELALQETKVALLLITADFMASDFINAVELVKLLEACEEDGAIIIPLIISPSLFNMKFQSINPPDKPLISLSIYDQEEYLVKMALTIESHF